MQATGVERTLLRHQATTWELVHVLFGAIEGEGGPRDPAQQQQQQQGQDGQQDDLMDGESLHRWVRSTSISRAAIWKCRVKGPGGGGGVVWVCVVVGGVGGGG